MTKLVALDHVFTVKHGNKFDLNKMRSPTPSQDAIAFIGRSGERNGITTFVAPVKNVEPFAKGLITVALGGAALSSFVQPKPFYTAQNIDVLDPKEAMSLDEKLYYCLCIEANKFRYSTFGREANRTLKSLLVPARSEVPAWVEGSLVLSAKELASDLIAASAAD